MSGDIVYREGTSAHGGGDGGRVKQIDPGDHGSSPV